ncbi:ROK family transcriptional regulator [Arthrobacter monumenti]
MTTSADAALRTTNRGTPGRVGDVRRQNLALIMHRLDAAGQMTRAQLAAGTGLTKASVSSLVADLMSAGLVSEVGLNRIGERGRPGLGVALNTAAAALGMEINVDYIAVGVLDFAGELHFHAVREEHNAGRPPAEVLSSLKVLADEALEQASDSGMRVHAGGLAVPGLVDPANGRVQRAPNIGWRDVDVAQWADALVPTASFGTAVFNEANTSALAELWYGHGRNLDNYLFISGEVGIGGGVIIGSELFEGPGGNAGEIGHVVVDPNGPECSCGGAGCLERYAGQEAILGQAGVAGNNTVERMTALVESLDNGESAAMAAVERAGHHLGVATASTLRMLNLDAVVLGGHFAQLERWIIPAFKSSVNRHAPTLLTEDRTLVSELGPRAAVMGAAGSRVRSVLQQPYELFG